MESEIPEWVESAKWLFAAAMLALAIVGPKVFGPLIEKWRHTLPPPSNGVLSSQHLAVVGAALADKDAVQQLALAVNRLCDIMEERIEKENELSQEAKTRRIFKELLDQMRHNEEGRHT